MTETHANLRRLKLIWPLLLLVFILVVGTGGTAIHLSRFYRTPQGDPATTLIYTIKRGQSFNTTARQLVKAGLCSSETKLRFMATVYGLDKKIKAGEYRLSGAMTPEEILTVLTSGKVHLRRLTIPEGYTVRQIADVVEQSGLGEAALIMDLCFSEPFTRRMELPGEAPSLEGYLFPETYLFEKGTSEEAILAAMVGRFKAVFTEELQQEGKALGLSPNQVVTLASIIEKETGAPSERPIISSVFHNRLKKRMRLETDPTVIYGIKDFNGNITRKDLRRRTPYNTYVIKGLPPGPIASPGLAALTAAVRPEDTGYLYFVSKKDGSHHFSRTFKEHSRAVRKYQLNR
ncbi:endolytic transglycosylase MltG [Desulfoluna butyratoxydans]|uniref:Endolytic murein transglycosylase n=1 Tax=Desulfoluna butyratoxydans TaxID=231438 RepID=A0A4U8YRP3_9BACT|nr:endolytic transglycosylase MltG [Desulfoluna butyratoxydans]VFQ46404.1 endolytic murein transglycosylase [Desulfoluna butyratoxydans]